jgi:two-component system OmpR family response regulator
MGFVDLAGFGAVRFVVVLAMEQGTAGKARDQQDDDGKQQSRAQPKHAEVLAKRVPPRSCERKPALVASPWAEHSTLAMHVLLVEDDPMIGRATAQALTDAAHAVDWVTDGAMGLAAARDGGYDLLLLDLGLAELDGVEVLRAVRQHDASLPIMVVTARDHVDSRVNVLDLGADDYLVKPFEVKELLARIRAVVRRKGGSGTPLLTCGQLTLDPASHEATFRDARCRLSGREFALMEALVRRPGAILSRAELEQRIYGWGAEVESNTVEVLVHGVRRKLGQEAIRTVRGVGYRVDRSA